MKKLFFKSLRALTLVAVLFCGTSETFATTYYVSQSTGNDNFDGKAASASINIGPWKTLLKASSVKYQPGDQLLLKCGDIWDETLRLTGDGTPTQPITVASYGIGERPYIRRTIGDNDQCIVFENVCGYIFRDLEMGYALTGINMSLGAKSKKGVYEYLRFENCFFHDIYASLVPPPVEKRTNKWGFALFLGGHKPINVVVKNCIGLRTQSFFNEPANDSVFEGNTIAHTSFNQVGQTWGWHQDFYNNVFVYNYPWWFSQAGTTQLLAGNLTAGNGNRNEVIGNEFGWPGDYPDSPDGCGYDFEDKTENVTFQNNFVHNSYGEAVLFMGKHPHPGLIFDNNIFRNNVRFSTNPGWEFDVAVDSSVTGSGVFSNNKFFSRPGKRAFSEKPSCFTFVNNEEQATGTFVEMPRVTRIESAPGRRTYTLACATPGAEIRFTTDASLPNEKSPVYTGPVTLKRSGALNAKGFKKGCYPSYVNAIVAEMREPEGRAPVAWWKMDETRGPTIADAAGTNHGRIVGAQPTAGRLGGALAFSGTNQSVELDHRRLDAISDNFTIAFWAEAKSDRALTREACSGSGLTGVCWLKMDEATGIMLKDSCGGHPEQIVDCQWTEGKFGSALQFSGTTNAVSLRNSSLKTVSDNFTVSFWAEPAAEHAPSPESGTTSSGMKGQRYALSPIQYSGTSGGCGLGVSVGTNGVNVYELADGYLPSPLVASLSLTGWNLITLVYRDKQPSLYVNGKFVKKGIKSKKTVHPAFTLGGGMSGYQGKLDDLRVYSRSLTDAEILELATKGDAANVPWSLDKMAGTVGLPYALGPIRRGGGPDASHAGVGVSVGTSGISVVESSDDYLPSVLVDNLPQKGWNHIAVVYRNKQTTLYVNGMFEKSGHTSTKTVHPSFNFGGGNGLGFFGGKLDDVRVYNCALTDAEIQVLASGN